MAALPYMQLYVADYLADTAHLSTVEHGAYLLLIFNYWQRGESFKAKDEQSLNKRLTSVTRTSNEEWQQIKNVLSEFFVVTETEWSHERIERDLLNAARFLDKSIDRCSLRPSSEVWRTIRESVFRRDDYTCQYCGERGKRLECDHIFPVSRGGGHEFNNLTTACFACNRSKRDKTIKEWKCE